MISKREKSKLLKWLNDPEEKWGTVKQLKNKNLIFENNHKKGPVMFHTHPTDEKDGGFSPPSVHDMIEFINMRKTTNIQYVISERGIYKLEFYCKIRKFTELKKKLIKMKKELKPGMNHHKKWIKTINSYECLSISFKTL